MAADVSDTEPTEHDLDEAMRIVRRARALMRADASDGSPRFYHSAHVSETGDVEMDYWPYLQTAAISVGTDQICFSIGMGLSQ